jgi:replicative DNA helicase
MLDSVKKPASPKHPPHSIEAEQSVLGGLMLNNRAIDDIIDILVADDFYTQDHRVIFTAILQLNDARKPSDFITLSEHLRQQNKLDEAGGVPYLGTLAADTPSAANVLAYGEIVRERAMLRQLIAAGQDIAELGYSPNGEAIPELVDVAEGKVYAIRDKGAGNRATTQDMSSIMATVESRVEEARAHGGNVIGLSTGLIELDEITTGLHPGDLVIIGGRPGMGKTALAMGIAESLAIYEEKPVGVFSMEMPAAQLGMRTMSSHARIPLHNIRTGQLNEEEWSRFVDWGGRLRAAPMFVDDAGGLSPLELRARARRMKSRHDIKLLVVDYIQLMTVPGSKENRTNIVSEISRGLKALAKELGIPVIALSQLSRGVESRDNKRPRMSDLRESGSIEQDADLVLFAYRDEYYNKDSPDRGTAEILVEKQRNGARGVIRVGFQGEFTRFGNLAASWRPEEQPDGPRPGDEISFT